MAPYIPINQIKTIGKEISQVFMVSVWNMRKSSRGVSYVDAIFQDVTGQIKAKIWQCKLTLNPGDFVLISGTIETYQNVLQIVIQGEKLQKFTGSPSNLTDYVAGMNEDVLKVYEEELRKLIDKIDDTHYRDIFYSADQRIHLIDILKESPYGFSGPLAFRGGLLLHVLYSMKCALAIVDCYWDLDICINKSLIILGSIFKNIGWYTITDFSGNVVVANNSYQLTGLERASFRLVHDLLLHVESDLNVELPEAKKLALENITQNDSDIRTIESQIIANASKMTNTLYFGNNVIRQNYSGDWAKDLFIGHLERKIESE